MSEIVHVPKVELETAGIVLSPTSPTAVKTDHKLCFPVKKSVRTSRCDSLVRPRKIRVTFAPLCATGVVQSQERKSVENCIIEVISHTAQRKAKQRSECRIESVYAGIERLTSKNNLKEVIPTLPFSTVTTDPDTDISTVRKAKQRSECRIESVYAGIERLTSKNNLKEVIPTLPFSTVTTDPDTDISTVISSFMAIESVVDHTELPSSQQANVKPVKVELTLSAEPFQSSEITSFIAIESVVDNKNSAEIDNAVYPPANQITVGPQSPELTVIEKQSQALEMNICSIVQSVFVFSNKPCKKDDLEANPTRVLPKVHHTPQGEQVKTDSSVAIITFDSPVKETESTHLAGCTTVQSVFLEGCEALVDEQDTPSKVAKCTTETVEINSVASTAPTYSTFAEICEMGSLKQKEGLVNTPACQSVVSPTLMDIKINPMTSTTAVHTAYAEICKLEILDKEEGIIQTPSFSTYESNNLMDMKINPMASTTAVHTAYAELCKLEISEKEERIIQTPSFSTYESTNLMDMKISRKSLPTFLMEKRLFAELVTAQSQKSVKRCTARMAECESGQRLRTEGIWANGRFKVGENMIMLAPLAHSRMVYNISRIHRGPLFRSNIKAEAGGVRTDTLALQADKKPQVDNRLTQKISKLLHKHSNVVQFFSNFMLDVFFRY